MTTTSPTTTVGPGHPFYQSGPWRVRVTNATGSHDFYLTITQNGCESPASITTVVIEDAPVAAPSSAYTLQADCAPENLELFANASSGSSTITYSWSGPNGFSSSLENPVIPNATEASNGSYVLTINDGNVCTATETVEVSGIMNQEPMPLISHNGAECVGDLVELPLRSMISHRQHRLPQRV